MHTSHIYKERRISGRVKGLYVQSGIDPFCSSERCHRGGRQHKWKPLKSTEIQQSESQLHGEFPYCNYSQTWNLLCDSENDAKTQVNNYRRPSGRMFREND